MKIVPFKKIGARAIAANHRKEPVKCECCGRLAYKEEWGVENKYWHSAEYRLQAYPGFGEIPTYQKIEACFVVQPGRVLQVRKMLESKSRVKFGGIQYTAESLAIKGVVNA